MNSNPRLLLIQQVRPNSYNTKPLMNTERITSVADPDPYDTSRSGAIKNITEANHI